jgi:DNA-binding Lrp family transcriptional regulator
MIERVQLDNIDQQILALLQENARRTIADIATRVRLSAAPVTRRIDRLERSGVIVGYTVVVDHARVEPEIQAVMELRIAGDADVEAVVAAVAKLSEVQETFTIAGDPDLLLRVRVMDVAHLKRVVVALRRTGGIVGTKTLMVLDRWARA